MGVLKRDKFQCQVKRPGCTGNATVVDHIKPAADFTPGDPAINHPSNLQAACRSCNVARRPKEIRAVDPGTQRKLAHQSIIDRSLRERHAQTQRREIPDIGGRFGLLTSMEGDGDL
ncbi:MAG: HNH endonuclease [Solirubrobacterales bacterium]|nr:HNH endonuclease [Solirubrobacterales bacterium]